MKPVMPTINPSQPTINMDFDAITSHKLNLGFNGMQSIYLWGQNWDPAWLNAVETLRGFVRGIEVCFVIWYFIVKTWSLFT